MTDEQKRVLIAQACGWTLEVDYADKYDARNRRAWFSPDVADRTDSHNLKFLPDYFNDLNACAEMEKTQGWWSPEPGTAKDREAQAYFEALLDKCCEYPGNSPYMASARQRCEAFGKTKGLWA